ncbi:MAG TPA: AI-2E family transporter [Pseudonocardiaceae bacterium]|nr:AI-2E family transporter [Pseudonocardiaceae bacterium]
MAAARDHSDERRKNAGKGSGRRPGHRVLVAQPHSRDEGPVAVAEAVAARMSTAEHALGRPGRPVNRRSPFFIGMSATAGVAVMAGVVEMIVTVRDILVLIGLALFLAIGLEPAVSAMTRRKLPRWAAVTIALVTGLVVVGGFLAAAVPPLARQASQFLTQAPTMLPRAFGHNSVLGQLDERFHLQPRLQQILSGDGSGLVNGLLGAGQVVFSALSSTVIVIVLTVYFLADLPRIRANLYRLVPHSRRPRAILLGDEIFAKVGGYVLGNLLISLIAGILTFIAVLLVGLPYPLLLSIFVALLDLVPVIGSTIAGGVVCLVALSVSLPACAAVTGFFVAYRLVEDYLLVPRIIGRVLRVPALVTVVAVLVGGALLGIVGALVAIPVAAAVLLLAREVLFPRLDET